MSTSIYPSSFLAFPFLSIENGIVSFYTPEGPVNLSLIDLRLASVASITLFQDNDTITVTSSIDFDSLTTATIATTDYIIFQDGSDSNLVKKGLVSDILGAPSIAPSDATYVTLTSNSTLINESVLAAGTGISLVGSTVSVDFAEVQPLNATLTSIASLGTVADRYLYTTALDTWAEGTITSFARTVLDDATASDVRNTIGLGTIATQNASNVSISGGSISGITDIAVADGGTGASNAGDARTNLGLAIGSDIQAYDVLLDSLSALADPNADKILFWDDSAGQLAWLEPAANLSITGTDLDASGGGGGGGLSDGDYGDITVSGTSTVLTIDSNVISTFGRTLTDDADAATARTTLGLGTISTQNANNVSITGGSVTGITDLAIADGGTGASTATAAFNALSPLTTQGDILYHNGTNNVRLAPGTSGQVLTTQGAGANPIWDTASGGGWTLISTSTPSSAASVELTLSGYTFYMLRIVDLIPATDNVDFDATLKNGSTERTSNYSACTQTQLANSATYTGDNYSTVGAAMRIGGQTTNIGNAAGEGIRSGEVLISGAGNSGVRTTVVALLIYSNTSGITTHQTSQTLYETEETADAIILKFSSGNIASGTIYFYGI